MPHIVKFTVPGKAVPKARPRRGKYGGVYTPKNTVHYENLVKLSAQYHFDKPVDAPIELHVKFKLPRPKKIIWKTKPMPEVPTPSKPDLDNLLKSVIDGLSGVAFYDDRQIWKITAEKVYHAGDDKPEVMIEIRWQ